MEEYTPEEDFKKKEVAQKDRVEDGPDGRSAWLVAIAACLINFIMAGLQRMSGLLFVAFMKAYGADRKMASTPFSVRASTGNLLGPIVGIIGQKYGARPVIVTGCVITAFSTVLCFFAQDINWIIILWGGLGGIGTALVITLPQVVIGQYFNKYRTTAAGMAFSGGCVGAFLFPSVINYLLDNYGVQGTLLVIGGFIMHTIPAAMILKKPSWLRKEHESEKSVDETKKQRNEVANAKFLQQNSVLIGKMLSIGQTGGDLKENRIELSVRVLCLLEEIEELTQKASEKSKIYQNLTSPAVETSDENKNECKPTLRKRTSLPVMSCSPFPKPVASDSSNAYLNKRLIIKLKDLSCKKLPQVLAEFPRENKRTVQKVYRELSKLYHITIKEKSSGIVTEKLKEMILFSERKSDEIHRDSFLDHIKTALQLHTKPMFIMICLCRAVHFMTFLPVLTTIVDCLKDKGFQPEDGNYAIAAMSLGDLFGRLCFGWVTDKGFLSIGKYMMIVMTLQGGTTASLPTMDTRMTLFACLGVFGMLQGSLFVRHPVLVSKYMESHEQSIAMGCINFFSGLLGFGLPMYIGFFRDTLGSYDYIFYINGAFGAVVGLLWGLEPYFQSSCSRQKTKKEIV